MSPTVFALVLVAAAVHASWNAILKRAPDILMTTVCVAAAASLVAALGLPFLPAPAPESWPFIAASTLVQFVYYLLLARIYAVADMSLAYPLMRGTAPLLVALCGLLLLDEVLPPGAWGGIAIICLGIFAMAAGPRHKTKGAGLALLNAVMIAGFTLIDAMGVRRSGAPMAYVLWASLLPGLLLLVWALFVGRERLRASLQSYWQGALIAGVGTVVAYGIALWAMTLAPVAMVAALRETSILFAAAISVFILKENVSPVRLAAAGLILLGAVVLRLS